MSEDKKEPNIEEFKKELEECEKKATEYLSGWQRERADFLNYKKEEMERIGELIAYSNEELILKFLPILDNFEIATRQTFPSENLSGQEKEKINQAIQGFLQIKIQLEEFLKSQGVEEIKSIGEKFDPHLHEVIEDVFSDLSSEASAKEEASTQAVVETKESGTIVEEIQKGYKINGRLLRPAKVKVTK